MSNPQYADKLIKEDMTGMVVRYNPDPGKSFGFIRANSKAVTGDVFVFFNQIVPESNHQGKEHLKLHQYQEVTFDLYMSPKGYVAKRVRRGEILTELLIKEVNDEDRIKD